MTEIELIATFPEIPWRRPILIHSNPPAIICRICLWKANIRTEELPLITDFKTHLREIHGLSP